MFSGARYSASLRRFSWHSAWRACLAWKASSNALQLMPVKSRDVADSQQD